MKDTFLYDFKVCNFVMEDGNPIKVSGIEALKVWITKILHTQLNRYQIYAGTSYGANIEDLVIGKGYSTAFIQSELKREIETALLQNEDIEYVSDFVLTREKDKLDISFTVGTVYGEETYIYDG